MLNWDTVIVGGGIANTFLKAKNINIGNSLYEESLVEKAEEFLEEYGKKIILPKCID